VRHASLRRVVDGARALRPGLRGGRLRLQTVGSSATDRSSDAPHTRASHDSAHNTPRFAAPGESGAARAARALGLVAEQSGGARARWTGGAVGGAVGVAAYGAPGSAAGARFASLRDRGTTPLPDAPTAGRPPEPDAESGGGGQGGCSRYGGYGGYGGYSGYGGYGGVSGAVPSLRDAIDQLEASLAATTDHLSAAPPPAPAHAPGAGWAPVPAQRSDLAARTPLAAMLQSRGVAATPRRGEWGRGGGSTSATPWGAAGGTSAPLKQVAAQPRPAPPGPAPPRPALPRPAPRLLRC